LQAVSLEESVLRKKFVFFPLVLLFGLFATTPVFAKDVLVWGSTTCQKIFLEPGKQGLAAQTGINTRTISVGTGKGLIALIHGKADIAAASASLPDAIAAARKQIEINHLQMTVPDNLVYSLIHTDLIIPIIHPSNPVVRLSRSQLKAINTGKITNWREVGGHNLPIQVVTSSFSSATRLVVQKLLLNGEEYSDSVIELSTTREEMLVVADNPAAIGAVSRQFVELHPGLVKALFHDGIERPLGLITIGEPSSSAQALIDYYRTGNGREYF
jgi:phosphate transport system substrate-binding protein